MNWIKLSYIFPSILDLKIFHEYINTLYTRIYTFLSKSSLKLSSLFKQNFRTFNAKLSEIPSYRISEKLSDKIFPIVKKKRTCVRLKNEGCVQSFERESVTRMKIDLKRFLRIERSADPESDHSRSFEIVSHVAGWGYKSVLSFNYHVWKYSHKYIP